MRGNVKWEGGAGIKGSEKGGERGRRIGDKKAYLEWRNFTWHGARKRVVTNELALKEARFQFQRKEETRFRFRGSRKGNETAKRCVKPLEKQQKRKLQLPVAYIEDLACQSPSRTKNFTISAGMLKILNDGIYNLWIKCQSISVNKNKPSDFIDLSGCRTTQYNGTTKANFLSVESHVFSVFDIESNIRQAFPLGNPMRFPSLASKPKTTQAFPS